MTIARTQSTPQPRKFLTVLAITCLAVSFASVSQRVDAQAYPNKPVRIVVPYTPGGGIDVAARLVAAKLTEAWGQSVVVENRPGAGGNIGVDVVAKSPADGYSFVMVANTVALATASGQKLSYDLMKDLTPVVIVSRAPFVLTVNPRIGAQNVQGLLAVAKSRPNGLNFASAGQGTTTHLALELLKLRTGMPALHVPYKGSGPALTDLIDGRVDALFSTPAPVIPHVAAKRLLALAVTSRTRLASAPEIPTMIESGVPSYEMVVWFGILAPAGTPPAIINKFHADTAKALQTPELRDRLATQGQEVAATPPAEFATILRDEVTTMGEVIKKAGITLQ